MLSVVFRGKPTRHKIAKNTEGVLCINNKMYGDDANVTLKQLIALLFELRTRQ